MTPSIATVGTFDGFHDGHRDLIAQLITEAAERGLSAEIITFNEHPLCTIAPARAPKLLFTREYLEHVLNEQDVDHVDFIDFSPDIAALTARQFLAKLRRRGVKVLMMGFNNSFGSDRPASRQEYIKAGEDEGVEVIFAREYIDPISGLTPTSSMLRRMVREGNMEEFARLTDGLYTLEGKVLRGKQNGHKLGFPTLNLGYDPRRELPAVGVYAGYVLTGYRMVKAVVNVGNNPTISADNPITIEAHCLGCDMGELYGHQISIAFAHRLRGEQKFDGLDALRQAIAADARRAEAMLQEP